jgi:hypothetical protein
MAEPIQGVVSDDEPMACDEPTRDNNLGHLRETHEENPAEKVEEWTLLVKLVTSSTVGDVNIVTIHRDIISKMRKTDPTIGIVTETGETIMNDEDFPGGNDYERKFEMKETKNQFTVAHKMFSSKSLDEIKRDNPGLIDFLNSNNVYLDVSATGSLTEVLLGPFFGIHPDNTSKKRLEKDLYKIISVHQNWDLDMTALHEGAKMALDFDTPIPAFQLRTRRIKRKINDVEYSAKAVVFICAVEHRQFWEELLVSASAEGWLNSIGRFYLLQRDDKSDNLRTAISWHNSTIEKLKAVVITGIDSTVMDAGILPPHDNKVRPSLREKLHSGGGFVTIVSTHEKNKWFGITTNPTEARQYVNTILKDICEEAYHDDTKPVASDPVRVPKKMTIKMINSEDRSRILDTQCKSWAELTRVHNADEGTLHTESNIPRRPPRTVQFISKVRFGKRSQNDAQTDTQTNASAADSTHADSTTNFTTITQDDLTAMEKRINDRNDLNKKESEDTLSSAISALSALSESATDASQAKFLMNLDSRWNKQEKQIQAHNAIMQTTMSSMQDMMNAMKQFVEAATSAQSPSNSQTSPQRSRNNSMEVEDDPVDEGDDLKDYSSAAEQDEEDYWAPPVLGSKPAVRRSKRKSVKSPEMKQDNRPSGGRGSAAGRTGNHRTVRANLANRYAPLAESAKNSPSGSS